MQGVRGGGVGLGGAQGVGRSIIGGNAFPGRSDLKSGVFPQIY